MTTFDLQGIFPQSEFGLGYNVMKGLKILCHCKRVSF